MRDESQIVQQIFKLKDEIQEIAIEMISTRNELVFNDLRSTKQKKRGALDALEWALNGE